MRFYKNLKDDLHCFQAALLIVLSIYFPKKRYTYKEIDRVTGFRKGAVTWDSQGLLWLAKKGFEIVRISSFDYKRFAKEGESYLHWFWRSDVYDWQSKQSNFKQEQRKAQKLIPFGSAIKKQATVNDIEKLTNKGYTIVASINPRVLDRKKGYANHSVVIVSISNTKISFHDPGLPPQENRTVTKKQFQKALHEIVAIRPNIIVRK